jgi:hypothetical protein
MSSSRYNRRNDRSDAPKAPAAPVIERPGPDILSNGKKDWSRYNATIVGAAWDLRAPAHPAYAPGLIPSNTPYRTVFFGADREYGPDEGWQKVRPKRSSKKRRARQAREAQEAVTLSID